jgi:acyl carrier protein
MHEVKASRSAAPSRQAVVEQIARMVEPFRKGSGAIGEDTDLTGDLNLDSLAVMDLLMELEEAFDVSIPLNVVPEIRTVADLAETILRMKREA